MLTSCVSTCTIPTLFTYFLSFDIPTSSFVLNPMYRYIGRKTRIDAEVALHRLRDGVFLIRESMDRPGEYAVALR